MKRDNSFKILDNDIINQEEIMMMLCRSYSILQFS